MSSFVRLAGIILCLCLASAAHGATVEVVDVSMEVGQVGTTYIRFVPSGDPMNVYGVSVRFTFDPQLVSVAAVRTGSDLAAWGGPIFNVYEGTLAIAIASAFPATDPEYLFEVDLEGVAVGNSVLGLYSAGLNEAQPDRESGVATVVSQQLGCTVGAYADVAGAVQFLQPSAAQGQPLEFDVYYILLTDDSATDVAWQREVTGFGSGLGGDLLSLDIDAVPTYGSSLATDPEGYQLTLDGCVPGFGNPIVLMRETFQLAPGAPGGTVRVLANTLEDPQFSVFETCVGGRVVCNGLDLIVSTPVPTTSRSWGGIKAMYGRDG